MNLAEEKVKCPDCGSLLPLEVVSKLTDQSSVTFKIKPHPGQFLSAATAFASIIQVDKALKALGREHGLKTTVTIRSISTSVDGEITIVLLAANAVK